MNCSVRVLSVVIFLVFTNPFAQSLSIDPNAGRLQLSSLLQHSVGKILSEFGHSAIAKRQTVYDITIQDVVDCISRTIEYQCGSSGYSQKVVDIATSCKNDSYARNTANTCTRNEKGETCGAVTLKFLSDQTNAKSCLGSVANDICPSDCRGFLQSAKNTLGCCVNAYVNKTDYPLFKEYREHVDYRLWDLCEVALPEEECKDNEIKFDSFDVKTCTSQELLSSFVRYECSADVGQSLVNNLMKNDRCYIFSSIMVDACSSNGNGQYCAESIGTDLTTNFVTDPYIIALNSNCGARDPDSGCSSACKESINDIKNAYGCCVNVYNDSSIGLQLGALSYSVWNECGIESPGFCEATQTIPTKPPVLTTTDSIQATTDSIQATSEDIQTTIEDIPVTERAPPIASSEQPSIGVIVATDIIIETTEHIETENMVSTDEATSTEPSAPTVHTQNTPEEVQTTSPAVSELETTMDEGIQTTAPTESVSTASDPQTTQSDQTTSQEQPTLPTASTEDTETIERTTEESLATDHHTQTEPTQPQSEPTSSASEGIETTEATPSAQTSDHSNDHTQIFSLPTVNSETTGGVVNEDGQIAQTTKNEPGTDHSTQSTESSAPPSSSPPRLAQSRNDSATSTRALVSTIISVVAITLFIQLL